MVDKTRLPEKPETASEKDGADSATELGSILHAAAYAGIQQPLDGTAQLINAISPIDIGKPNLIDAPKESNLYTTTGSLIGHVGDFFLMSKAVRGITRSAMGRATTVPILETGATGALFELSMPVQGDDVIGQKLRNAAVGFGTFATMDGASLGLRQLKYFENPNTLMKRVSLGGISGSAGGVSHTFLDAGINDKPLNYYTLASNAGSYAAFGAMFGGLEHGVARAHNSITTRIQERVDAGQPIVSIGSVEIHPRGYASRSMERAQTDGLTGLQNKAGGDQSLAREVSRAHREKDPLSLTYMDLDNFKTVNDKLGHNYGDKVLTAVSEFIKRHFRRGTDIHVREGGDEFMVIMPNTEAASASRLASSFETRMRLGVTKEGVKPSELGTGTYANEVQRLAEMPREVSVKAGETHQQLAERLLKERMAITGEPLTPTSIEGEVARLRARTGMQQGEFTRLQPVEVYTQADISQLADKTAFQYLPQIGQLLKNRGVASEVQIQDALHEQLKFAAAERPLLGDLLVQKGYSTRDQVNSVFAEQMQLRQALQAMRDESLQGYYLGRSVLAEPLVLSTPMDIAAARASIPNVFRPQLEPAGIRELFPFEKPVPGEIVVGASTGVVTLAPGEAPAALKARGDALMFDKKAERKAQGLRHDRHEFANN